MRLLLIEDDTALCAALAPALGDFGRLEVCHTGPEGLALLASGGYDLCILDRMLPGLDGVTLLRAARAKGVTTPVLLLTALAGPGEVVDGLDAGADDMQVEDEVFEVYTDPDAFGSVLAALEEKGYTFVQAAVEMVPQNYVKLENEDDIKNMEKLIDLLEENDDVQNVWHNWDQD